jgi:hypothetical protein
MRVAVVAVRAARGLGTQRRHHDGRDKRRNEEETY